MIFSDALIIDCVMPEGESEMSSFLFFQVPLGVYGSLPVSSRSALFDSGGESLGCLLFREAQYLLLLLYSFRCP